MSTSERVLSEENSARPRRHGFLPTAIVATLFTITGYIGGLEINQVNANAYLRDADQLSLTSALQNNNALALRQLAVESSKADVAERLLRMSQESSAYGIWTADLSQVYRQRAAELSASWIPILYR